LPTLFNGVDEWIAAARGRRRRFEARFDGFARGDRRRFGVPYRA
jgi:hypothetical protein